jgi:short-subunit dehydrogenase
MTRFSDVLKIECQGTGVEVQTLCPGFVDTNFSQTNAKDQPKIFFPSPEKYVKCSIGTIGTASVTGYLPHDIQVIIIFTLPFLFCFIDDTNYCSNLPWAAFLIGRKL